jgi:hypothetical protein
MEPTSDQLRIAAMFEGDGGTDKDLEVKIKQVTEFTGCTNDQAAVALYDCDNDIQMACLKVIDAGGDAAKTADNWTAVEKPVKKEKDAVSRKHYLLEIFYVFPAYAHISNRFFLFLLIKIYIFFNLTILVRQMGQQSS